MKRISLSVLVILISINFGYIFAETMTETTSDGSIDVQIDIADAQPGEETKMKVDFLNTQTGEVQVHIDYTVLVENNGEQIFGPIPLTHTSLGTVTIPVTFQDGTNRVTVGVEGILFVPMPAETATFDVVLGHQASGEKEEMKERGSSEKSTVPAWVKNNAGWWANDQIDDQTFVSGIQFLIKEKIITVTSSPESSEKTNEIPEWIKNNANWWSEGLITDDDFLKGIEFLVSNGIISVEATVFNSENLQIGEVDLSNASPALGSKDAPITIIEFGDYQCPNCKNWFDNTKSEIITDYVETGKVKLYFVDAAHLGSDSISAARASYCAEDQEQYWDFHDYLYSKAAGIQNGWADVESLKEYADEVGLDTEKFASCIDSDEHKKRVETNIKISSNNNVKRTPSFVIVGDSAQEMIEGPQPFQVFEQIIDSILVE